MNDDSAEPICRNSLENPIPESYPTKEQMPIKVKKVARKVPFFMSTGDKAYSRAFEKYLDSIMNQ